MSASVVGSPQTIVDQMEEWVEVADLDGFNITRVTNFGTFEDFRDLITPELRQHSLIPESQENGLTLRERVVGAAAAPRRPSGGGLQGGEPSRTPRQRSAMPTTIKAAPRNVGLLVRLKARPETKEELEAWLLDMQRHAVEEPGTQSWYAFRIDELTFGIYDTFDHEDGRQDHIHGEIVKSLRSLQQGMLAAPPTIRQVDLLAIKPVPARSAAPVPVA